MSREGELCALIRPRAILGTRRGNPGRHRTLFSAPSERRACPRTSGRKRVPVLALVLALVLPVAGYAAPVQRPEIVDIRGTVQGREAHVSFRLDSGFPPEMVEALKSGIEISFRTTVRVERVHRNWFNTTAGEIRFYRSVRYDALARVYRLNRGRGEELLPDILSALDAMTHYEVVVPLKGTAERGKRYRAHVRTRLDRVGLSEPLRSIFFFSSLWDLETRWTRGYLAAP
jgi:hypothetical protein